MIIFEYNLTKLKFKEYLTSSNDQFKMETQESNYLAIHIETLFEECTQINGNLYVTNSFLSERKNELKSFFPLKDYELIAMGSSFRDLSKLGNGNNLFSTRKKYTLLTDNLDSEIDRILSYHSCLAVSQVFEIFESFLKNILSELILNNKNLIKEFKLITIQEDFKSIRASLRRIKEKNCLGFITKIRTISSHFKQHEVDNIWNQNMSDWFELVAITRHLTIHSRQTVNLDFLDLLEEKNLVLMFNKYFKIEDNVLVLTPYQADAIISHIYEYAFLIFKSLSRDFDLPQNLYKSY